MDHESDLKEEHKELERRRKIAWVIWSSILIIVCIMVGVFLGWTFRVHDFYTYTNTTGADLSFTGRTISLEADLISVDPVAGVMVIDWYIIDDSTCQIYGVATGDCTNAAIYFESHVFTFFPSSHLRIHLLCNRNPLQATLDSTGAYVTPSNEPPNDPVFVYYPNATASARGSISAWRTSISMIDRHSSKLRTGGYSVSTSLQSYPYDVYSANISFFAQELASSAPTPMRLEVTSSEGIAVGFKVLALSNRVSSTGDEGETLQISLQVSRGVLVKTYAIIIVAAVWIITLVFVCSTIASVVFGIAQKSELLVVPVATLFAVTQLRGSMPGAPAGFGAIVDYVGLLPCLAIMAACAALSVGVLVFTDPTSHRPPENKHFVDRILMFKYNQKSSKNEPA
ncbi:hypothetical protein HWV62_22732 [Athelia sp. TMB]|nr:hypothetical protein HWV62_22732 [Athelia sp. TMB]